MHGKCNRWKRRKEQETRHDCAGVADSAAEEDREREADQGCGSKIHRKIDMPYKCTAPGALLSTQLSTEHFATVKVAVLLPCCKAPLPSRLQQLSMTSLLLLLLVSVLLSAPQAVGLRSPPFSALQQRRPAQTLIISDVQGSGVEVRIIGTMHYNPQSISQVKEAVESYTSAEESLTADRRLRSIMIESCEERFSKSKQTNDFLRKYLLYNEMLAAAEYTSSCSSGGSVELILADQKIAVTSQRLKDSLKQALREIINPLQWAGLLRDLSYHYKRAFPSVEGSKSSDNDNDNDSDSDYYLGLGDFLDPSLLRYFAVSLVRYPLAIAVRSPALLLGAAVMFAAGSAFNAGAGAIASAVSGDIAGGVASASSTYSSMNVEDLRQLSIETVESLLIAALEVLVLGRPMLQVLLDERNEVIASNILRECSRLRREREESGSRDRDCVVVVLGMAHANGVKRLLLQQQEGAERERN